MARYDLSDFERSAIEPERYGAHTTCYVWAEAGAD